jgi:hypothetical protein
MDAGRFGRWLIVRLAGLCSRRPAFASQEYFTDSPTKSAEVKLKSWRTRVYGKTPCKQLKHPRSKTSYWRVYIDGKSYKAHRVIWLWVYGEGVESIDHINHNGLDNKLANLRSVTTTENARNVRRRADNKSGVTGVSWWRARNKWRAGIKRNSKYIWLGDYDTKADAVAARDAGNIEHGFHPNHGRCLT